MTKNYFFYYPVLIALLFFLQKNTFAQETAPVAISGDKLEYTASQKLITGTGNVKVEQNLKTLTADHIQYFIESDEIIATGNATFKDRKNLFLSEKIIYNIKTGTGIMRNNNIKSDEWYVKTPRFEIKDNKLLKMDSTVSITTCNLEKRHYDFEASKMVVYVNDKIIAYNVVLHVGNVPLFYVPIYYYSLKFSPLYILPGYSSKYGFWVKSKLHYTSPPYSYGSFILDWWERKSFGKGVEYNYYADENKQGHFYFYQIDEKAIYFDTAAGRYYNPGGIDPNKRWKSKIHINHEIMPSLNLKVNYERISDPDFKFDFEDIEERPVTEDNNFTLTKSYTNYNITLFAQEINIWNDSLKKYEESTKSMPELRVDFLKKRVGDVFRYPVYYKLDLSASHGFFKHYVNDYIALYEDDYHFDNSSITQALMTSFNILPRVSLSPTFTYKQNWFSNHNPVNSNDRIYGNYDTDLRLTMNFTRNIWAELDHQYSRQLSEYSDLDINEYDGITKNEVYGIITFETNDKKARMYLQTSYELRDQTNVVIEDDRSRYRDVINTIELKPTDNIEFTSRLYWDIYLDERDPYTPEFQSLHTQKFKQNDTYLKINHKFSNTTSASIDSRYYHIYIDDLALSTLSSYATIEGSLQFNLTNKWLIIYKDGFLNNRIHKQLLGRDFIRDNQEILLVRDLHCWEGSFGIRNRNEDAENTMVQEIILNFRLKAFPSSKLFELKETHYTPYSTYYNF